MKNRQDLSQINREAVYLQVKAMTVLRWVLTCESCGATYRGVPTHDVPGEKNEPGVFEGGLEFKAYEHDCPNRPVPYANTQKTQSAHEEEK